MIMPINSSVQDRLLDYGVTKRQIVEQLKSSFFLEWIDNLAAKNLYLITWIRRNQCWNSLDYFILGLTYAQGDGVSYL